MRSEERGPAVRVIRAPPVSQFGRGEDFYPGREFVALALGWEVASGAFCGASGGRGVQVRVADNDTTLRERFA